VPIPVAGTLPAKVVVVPQIEKSAPALATVGVAVLIIVTSSVEEVQGAFAIVHLNTLLPIARAVTSEVGELGVVTEAPPLITVQVPVPITAVFPAKVAVAAQTV
jgi:hypothetical protein